jgi:hypothetical protein
MDAAISTMLLYLAVLCHSRDAGVEGSLLPGPRPASTGDKGIVNRARMLSTPEAR